MLRKITPVYFKFCGSIFQNNRPCVLLSAACSFSQHNKSDTSVLSAEIKQNKLAVNKHNLFRGDRKSVLSSNSDAALTAIRSLTSTEDVLEYLRANPDLDIQLYSPILQSIFQLQKSGRSNLSPQALCRTNEIELLCRKIKKNARFLNMYDTVNILKVLLFLRVSPNSILCQHLLQMITKRVNQLGLSQIIFLNYILMDSPTSPLMESLKIALPVVFETNVRSQLSFQNSKAVAEAIAYAFRSKCTSDETLKYLIEAALRIKEKFSPQEAVNIVMAIFNLRKKPPQLIELYHEMMVIINRDVFALSFNDLNSVVWQSLCKFIHWDPAFYDHDLMKHAVDYVIKMNVDLKHIGFLLRNFNRVSYYCPELLDYTGDVLKNTSDFYSLSPIFVSSFVTCCSNCSHKPKFWDLYESKIVSYFEKFKSPDLPMIRVLTDLIIMRCWPTALIEYCFQKDFIEQFLTINKNNPFDYICILNLYQLVKSFYPGAYTGPLPSADVLEKALDYLSEGVDYPLVGALQQILGGRQYVISGVRTKFGHFIDHLIVKRKSGQTFAINPEEIEGTSGKLVETLNIPEDSYLIGIKVLSPAAFCLDGVRIRGKMKIFIRSIETLGIVAIPIPRLNWMNLPDYEKIPYLMNKINTRSPVNLSDLKNLNSSVLFEE